MQNHDIKNDAKRARGVDMRFAKNSFGKAHLIWGNARQRSGECFWLAVDRGDNHTTIWRGHGNASRRFVKQGLALFLRRRRRILFTGRDSRRDGVGARRSRQKRHARFAQNGFDLQWVAIKRLLEAVA